MVIEKGEGSALAEASTNPNNYTPDSTPEDLICQCEAEDCEEDGHNYGSIIACCRDHAIKAVM